MTAYAAVEIGREVTVSEGMITVAGWTGVGYITADPATGSGAYKISGGGNGGEIKFSDIAKTVAIIFSTLVVSAAVLAFIVLTAVLFFEKWVIATAAISLVLAWLLIRTSEFDNPNLKTALVDIFGNAASFAIGALFPHPLVTAIIFTLFYVMFDAYLLAKLWIDARKIDTYVIARLWIRARCYA